MKLLGQPGPVERGEINGSSTTCSSETSFDRRIRTSDGVRIDLRNIEVADRLLLFLGRQHHAAAAGARLILDLYDNTDEIVANGQTIVYSLHHTIGHLGIFVSGKVALKEHQEFVSCMDMIDAMPPGLYEATITEVTDKTENHQLIDGKYLFRLEARTLDDIRAFGVNSADDEKRFATVARVSEVNLGFYRTFVEPWVRVMTTRRRQRPCANAPAPLPFPHLLRRKPVHAADQGARGGGDATVGSPSSPDNPFLSSRRQHRTGRGPVSNRRARPATR